MYKLHCLNCEVKKLVAKAKVNSGLRSLIIYPLPFTDPNIYLFSHFLVIQLCKGIEEKPEKTIPAT